MPTYEYVCTTCKTPLEVVQSITEPSLTDCPNCPDGRLRKVFGNVGVVFKGSGFYRNDSREKARSTAKSDGAGKSKADDKAASTSGSKQGAGKTDQGSASSSANSTSGGSTPSASSSAGSTSSGSPAKKTATPAKS